MNDESLNKIKKQHVDNYRNAIIDIINNNTDVLVNEDITSLFKTPPLDSMDFLKSKILSFAKKNKIVMDTDNLNKVLDSYRKDILKCCEEIKKIREKTLVSKVKKTDLSKKMSIIKINKKDFTDINRDIRRIVKKQLGISFEKKILSKINTIFSKDISSGIKESIIADLTKYMKGHYQKQLLENVDIKVLVKDTTLMNSVKEQSERYVFTMKNSRLLNDSIK